MAGPERPDPPEIPSPGPPPVVSGAGTSPVPPGVGTSGIAPGAGTSPVPPARTALVTGANRGLGRAIAVGLASRGVAVGLLGRSRPALEEVAALVAGAGGRSAVAIADVRDFAAVRRAAAAIEQSLGGVDLLVNNAGVIDPVECPVWAADPDDWWDVVEVDLRGPFHLVRAVVPGMVARGHGRVVDLSSGAGAQDREIYSAYCAAKAGLFRLSGNLHLAGFERGLRAFEISPGTVRTDMTASMPLHAHRTDWVPVQALVDLVLAAAGGELDAWSGCFLRAGVDTPASLAWAAGALARPGEPPGPDGAVRRVPSPARRLGVVPWGDDDPLG